MNQAQAIAKLTKVFGKKFAYRVDSKALVGEAKEAAKAATGSLAALKRAASEAR